MGKEVGAGEQYPIKEDNIVNLHEIEHREKPRKELPETEAVFHAVPRGENGRAEKKRERERHDDPADDMRAGKRSCLSGIAADFSFGAKEKKNLS